MTKKRISYWKILLLLIIAGLCASQIGGLFLINKEALENIENLKPIASILGILIVLMAIFPSYRKMKFLRDNGIRAKYTLSEFTEEFIAGPILLIMLYFLCYWAFLLTAPPILNIFIGKPHKEISELLQIKTARYKYMTNERYSYSSYLSDSISEIGQFNRYCRLRSIISDYQNTILGIRICHLGLGVKGGIGKIYLEGKKSSFGFHVKNYHLVEE